MKYLEEAVLTNMTFISFCIISHTNRTRKNENHSANAWY